MSPLALGLAGGFFTTESPGRPWGALKHSEPEHGQVCLQMESAEVDCGRQGGNQATGKHHCRKSV